MSDRILTAEEIEFIRASTLAAQNAGQVDPDRAVANALKLARSHEAQRTALEEADRQLADLERERARWEEVAREDDKAGALALALRAHERRSDKHEAAEAALKVATDALERMRVELVRVDGVAREKGERLQVATDALEEIDEHSGSLMNVKRIAREALAAIRQNT